MKTAMFVRWWVILILVVVVVAVVRSRRQPAIPTRAESDPEATSRPTASPAATRFQWGDAVDVADDSLGPARRGTRGLVVEVSDPLLPAYRVEFADGSSEIVREASLAPADNVAG